MHTGSELLASPGGPRHLPIHFRCRKVTSPSDQLARLQGNCKERLRVPEIRGNWHLSLQLEAGQMTSPKPSLGLPVEGGEILRELHGAP